MKVPPKLQAKWAKKLSASGFKDIEAPERDTLRKWDSLYFKEQYTPDEFEAKQRYYELAGQLLFDHIFNSKKDKKLWELHTNGATWKHIAFKLKLSEKTVERRILYYASFIKS